MQPLFDLDILLYEVSSLGQFFNPDTEEIEMKSFDTVAEEFDKRVKEIEAEVWATKPSLFFMTENKQIYKVREKKKAKALKRANKRLEKNPLDDVAKEQIGRAS